GMTLPPKRRHPHQPQPSGRKQRTTTRRNHLGPTRPRRRIPHRHQKTTTRRHLGRNSNQTRNKTLRNRTQRTDNGRQSHPRNPRNARTNHQQTTPKHPRTDGPNNQNRTRHRNPSLDGHHQRKHSTNTRKTLTCKTTGAYSVSGVENTGNTPTPSQLQRPSTPTTSTAKDQNDRTT